MSEAFLRVPRISANDDVGILVRWLVEPGAAVAADQAVCEVEFSKTTQEVASPADGFLFPLHQAGDEVAVGAALASIRNSADAAASAKVEAATAATAGKVTAKARLLMQEHGVAADALSHLPTIREQDVRDYLASRPAKGETCDESVTPLTPIQRRTAAVVAESARTIPHSYLTRWLPADAVEQAVAAEAARHECMVSVTDCVLYHVAQLADQFPKVYASWRADGLHRAATLGLGFALNQPNGDLIVPVVTAADRLTLPELAGKVRGLQKRMLRHRLTAEDVSGGTITVTSLVGTEAHEVLPLIVPGQTAIVALADRCPAWNAYALTLAFDHRVLNGMEAAEYLAALGRRVEGQDF